MVAKISILQLAQELVISPVSVAKRYRSLHFLLAELHKRELPFFDTQQVAVRAVLTD